MICNKQNGICILCRHPAYLDRKTGNCLLVDQPINNCLLYSTSDNSKCKLCQDGFFGDNCTPCGKNCRNCQDQEVCFVCQSGFSLDSGRCENKCSINNCEICQNHTDKCNICKAGNWLILKITQLGYGLSQSKDECVKCENPNCHTCDKDASICTDCKESFWGETCEKEIEGCAQIQRTNGECMICQSSHFMDKNGLCVENEPIMGVISFVLLFCLYHLIF
jgi:hypothetical protein